MKKTTYFLAICCLLLLSCDQEDDRVLPCAECPTTYTGKLLLKGVCMNYVIEVTDGPIDPDLIAQSWVHEWSNVGYQNVFALGSICDFPAYIEEGQTFQFSIVAEDLTQDCAVCEAYTPVPNKRLKITVVD